MLTLVESRTLRDRSFLEAVVFRAAGVPRP